ncbi:conjugal transfer protein TraB [Rhizobium brockwellii]|uniref:Conjugal transfer protein TraB n=1 Tax=Rhizobium brockwellii TaxID=3019932 RepID=A0ABU3YYH7_9HYPH|nr:MULTISPECIES: conjugal transfer protein TraB [Rhizobium]MDV4183746.1 conjugal transfer protein TraB [Rhizobium brockwellii]MDV4190733.1 conjugal transfer protein TraB [Rhizobium brockwellii]NZD54855.1 conjugal transfer protein TraB [Rhizobium leguminosarum]QIO63363.1 conjugal transfer protein TraB [Rhizobium leguminosarum bv. trifolii]RWX35683.1 conjugal transfer protein TraB [Rhizobium leguminosarum]
MRHDWLQPLALAVASAVSGYLGWSGSALALPAAIAFPALWSMARSRRTASVVSAAYFLAASRGLPQGVAAFYQSDIWPGLILWLVASSSFVFVHAAFWSRDSGGWKALRYTIAMVLMALPPFGIVGWAHPITAAGVLFPGWGWVGLAAVTAGLASMTTRYRPAAAMALVGFWLWSAAFWTAADIGRHWQGVDLNLGNSLGRDNSLARHSDLVATLRLKRRIDTTHMLLPESALGFWTPSVAHLWRQQFTGTDLNVIAGAVVVDPEGYDNVLVRVSATESEILYRERMPVPGSMWQPWLPLIGKSGGARADFFANPIVSVGGKRVAPLICYEQLIIWPVLQSMLHDPDLIVAVGNDWWTKGTSIIAIQRASTEAWARLFDKPLIMSFNT